MINSHALYTLILDSSLKKACILLCQDSHTLFFKTYDPSSSSIGAPSSVTLSLHLDEALKKTNITPQNIGQIACGIGPGSYTGVRVAISITQTLGFALNVPVAGFCALKAIEPIELCSKKAIDLKTARVIDARSGGLFVLEEDEKEPKKIAIEEIGAWLKGISAILTPHPKIIQEKFSSLELLKPGIENGNKSAPAVLEADFCSNSLIECGLKALKAAKRDLSPIYLGKGHNLF